jgi:glycine cleavage system H protein
MTQDSPNRRYSKEHEWIDIDGNEGVVGITAFAAEALGDIVYLELPEVGKELKEGDAFGVIESIKSVNDLFAPVEGKVLDINEAAVDSPESVNTDPYKTWLIKLDVADNQNPILDKLMDHEAYEQYCKNNPT